MPAPQTLVETSHIHYGQAEPEPCGGARLIYVPSSSGVMVEMKFHPVCELFPAMQEKEFEALVSDSARSVLHEPIHVISDHRADPSATRLAATPHQAAPLPNHRHTLWSQQYA